MSEQNNYSFEWLSKIFTGNVVTSKSYKLSEQKIYTMNVHSDATKHSIKAAFKALFGIAPLAINIINQQGKRKQKKNHYGKKIIVQQSSTKKALIKLSPDTNFEAISA